MPVTIPSMTGVTPNATAGGDFTLLYECAMPLAVMASGTMGNNGAFTQTNSFNNITTGVKFFMYCPLNVISASTAAGWYYCIATGAATCTIYNNTWAGSMAIPPAVPSSPTAFATTGPGAVSGAPTLDAVVTMPIAANALSNNKRLRIRAEYVGYGSGSILNPIWAHGTAPTTLLTDTMTSNTTVSVDHTIAVRPGSGLFAYGRLFKATTYAHLIPYESTTLDPTAAWNLLWKCQRAQVADPFTLQNFIVNIE